MATRAEGVRSPAVEMPESHRGPIQLTEDLVDPEASGSAGGPLLFTPKGLDDG